MNLENWLHSSRSPQREHDGEELPKAFVVLREEASLKDEEVMKFIADRVSPSRKVRVAEFVDAIPGSATGKTLRKILRQPETKNPRPGDTGTREVERGRA